jgi:hypothetical protein
MAMAMIPFCFIGKNYKSNILKSILSIFLIFKIYFINNVVFTDILIWNINLLECFLENISVLVNKLNFIEQIFSNDLYKDSNKSCIIDNNVNNVEKDPPNLNNIDNSNLESNFNNKTHIYSSPMTIFLIAASVTVVVTIVAIFYLNPDIFNCSNNVINNVNNVNVLNVNVNDNTQLNLEFLDE